MKISLRQLAKVGDIFLINGKDADLDIEEGDAGDLFSPFTEDTAVFRATHETWCCSPDILIELNDEGIGTLLVNEGEDDDVDLNYAFEVTLKVFVKMPLTTEYLLRKSIGIIK